MMITSGNINDTTMMTAVLEDIRVPRDGKGRPRIRPDRVLADKGYPSKANLAWLRDRGIAATIPERDDQIAHRRKKPGRPIDFGDQQQERYKSRNVVERCFNKLKQWRGIAMRSDKLVRSYRAAVTLAATLIWIKTTLWCRMSLPRKCAQPLRQPSRLAIRAVSAPSTTTSAPAT